MQDTNPLRSDESLPEEVWSMKEPSKRKWSCPPDYLIASYLDATLREEERSRVEVHLTKCRHCRQVLGDTVIAQREIDLSPPIALFNKGIEMLPTRTIGRAWLLAPVAVVAIIVAVAITMLPRHKEQAIVPPPQSISAPVIAKSAAAPNTKPRVADVQRSLPTVNPTLHITFPRAGDAFKNGPSQIRWKGVPQAGSYEVSILASDGDLVWKSETRELALELPPNVSLKDGSYFISVTSYLQNRKMVKSKPVSFVVKR